MHSKGIKQESSNFIKGEYHRMDIDNDDDINVFDDRGNTRQVNIKNNHNEMYDELSVEEEISDKDNWKVIRAYFNLHGLVSQQIGSFNQFIDKNIQEIIDENKTINIDPDINYFSKNMSNRMSYELTFGQSHIAAHPQFIENNSSIEHKIFPNEARVRNLDYLSELSVDISLREKVYDEENNSSHFLKNIN